MPNDTHAGEEARTGGEAPTTDKHDGTDDEIVPVCAILNPDTDRERLVALGMTHSQVVEWGITEHVIDADSPHWRAAFADLERDQTLPLGTDDHEIVTDGGFSLAASFQRLREFIKAGREAEALGELTILRDDLLGDRAPEARCFEGEAVGSYLPADVVKGDEWTAGTEAAKRATEEVDR